MDDLVMYIIVRKDIKMSPGKLGAQCGHAVEMVAMDYYRRSMLPKVGETFVKPIAFQDWRRRNKSTKVVLGAKDKDFFKIKEEEEGECFVVTDAGHTELAEGTETVLVFWPMSKKDAPKRVRRLQLL